MKKKAFSLIEVLLAIILIGLAVASLLVANSSFTEANGVGTNLSTAQFLIEQIRELTTLLPVIDPQTDTAFFGAEEASLTDYDDLDDFDSKVFSPPISADRQSLNDFAAWYQQITVENVNPANFQHVESDHSTDFVRITVRVLLNFEEISSTSWIRALY